MIMIENIKTPFYLINQNELNTNLSDLKNTLNLNYSSWIIGYSFKTNSLPWVLNYMKNAGCYAEVVSFDEYNLAKLIGFDKEKIIYNGPLKDKKSFLEAINNNCIVNIETWREIRWLMNLKGTAIRNIGIRINFDIEEQCPNESTCGKEGGRFGFCMENGELTKAVDMLNDIKNVKINGLHLHTSSKTRSINIYKSIAEMAIKVIEESDLDIEYLDIGGGFFGGMPGKTSFNEYFSEISSILSKLVNFKRIKIIVEPGAALIASPVCFYTSVIDVKKTNRNIFITTDGSRNDIDPLMSKTQYIYHIQSKESTFIEKKQVISGYTCMEHDRLFELKNYHILCEGDRIIYEKIGSYTMCLSPLFIKYFPDVYLEKDDGKIIKIRSKWSPQEYIQGAVVE